MSDAGAACEFTRSLPAGAGNTPAGLPSGANGGMTDFQDTGATGGNGKSRSRSRCKWRFQYNDP